MADYAAVGTQTVTATPFDSTLTVERGASKRAKIFDMTTGFVLATPADILMEFNAQRGTTSGTGTAHTPIPLDPADGASVTTVEENHTAEPTYTADEILLHFGLHMRAAYRWVAAPGKEWVIPDSASNFIGFRGEHASAVPVNQVTVHFSE